MTIDVLNAGGDGASLVAPRSGGVRLFACWSVLFRSRDGVDGVYDLKVRVMTSRRFDRFYRAEAEGDRRWAVLRRGVLVVMVRLDG